jgi:hypothetical protein
MDMNSDVPASRFVAGIVIGRSQVPADVRDRHSYRARRQRHVCGHMEVLREVLALLASAVSTPQEFLAILTVAGGFIFELALKDIRLVLNEAESAGVPMPSVSVVRDRLITGIARGYSELDWSALGLLAAEEAGLTFEPADAHA